MDANPQIGDAKQSDTGVVAETPRTVSTAPSDRSRRPGGFHADELLYGRARVDQLRPDALGVDDEVGQHPVQVRYGGDFISLNREDVRRSELGMCNLLFGIGCRED
jgi:hypothetical protein